MNMRRYEFLVPASARHQANGVGSFCHELLEKFGGFTIESSSSYGEWRDSTGQIHGDETVRVFVDVLDTNENFDWIQAFRSTWATRWNQLKLYVTSFPIDVMP